MAAIDDFTQPTTKLDAVNIALIAIGQSPVPTLEAANTNTDAEVALKVLRETSKSIQKKGWSFNQDLDIVLDPAPDGSVSTPANTLKVRMAQSVWSTKGPVDLVLRGRKLYDRLQHTFKIGQPVHVDLTICLDYDDLPESFRWWIALKSARRFVDVRAPGGFAHQITESDEKDAQVEAEQEDAEIDQRTLRSNPAFANFRRR